MTENVSNSSVENCYLENIDATGIYVGSGTKNITVKNNEVYKYGRRFFCAIGIQVIACDTADISNNEIHDGYYTGISDGWSWGYADSGNKNIQITDNLIYDIGQGWLSDMGGIYTLGVQPGTVLSGNIIHNVAADPEEGGYGGWGIYLDEGSSELTVTKNLVFACGEDSYNLHYGKDNKVYNNIFALSAESQANIVGRCEGHITADFTGNIMLTTDGVPVFTETEKRTPEVFKTDGNIVWDLTEDGNVSTDYHTFLYDNLLLSKAEDKGILSGSIYADPGFTDPMNFDFSFKDTSVIDEYGFESWDYTAGTLAGTVIGIDRAGGETAYNENARFSKFEPVSTGLRTQAKLFFIIVLLCAAFIVAALLTAKKLPMPDKIIASLLPFAALILGYAVYRVFVEWNQVLYFIFVVLFVLLSGVIPALKARLAGKKAIKTYIIFTAAFSAAFFAMIITLNNLMRIGEEKALFICYIAVAVYYVVVTVILHGFCSRRNN